MELTLERRSFLAGEHRGLGWPAIPENCPAHVQTRIVEWRNANFSAKRTATPAPKAVPVVATETKREQMRKRLALTSL
jgi:hypothetical protein